MSKNYEIIFMKALLIEGFPTLARMCLGFPNFLIADFNEFSMIKTVQYSTTHHLASFFSYLDRF